MTAGFNLSDLGLPEDVQHAVAGWSVWGEARDGVRFDSPPDAIRPYPDGPAVVDRAGLYPTMESLTNPS